MYSLTILIFRKMFVKKCNRLQLITITLNLPDPMRMTFVESRGNIFISAFILSCFGRYMKSFKPVTATNMLQCLQRHKKYNWAKALIEERITDCLIHGVR